MVREAQQTRDIAEEQAAYFRMMADLDFTKHIGGIAASSELATLCGLGAGDLVLDVGCGVGITTVNLVRQYECRVLGVDYTPSIVSRAEARARGEHVEGQTAFQVGDAQCLPYANNVFDAVIAESVLSFVPDRQQAVDEMVRVTRPGGHVAFTEPIWIQPPAPEMARFMARAAGLPAGLLAHEDWQAIVGRAGLQETVARQYTISGRSEARNQFRQLGLGKYLCTFARSLGVIFKPEYRALMQDARRQPIGDYFAYMGYGIYAGLKA